MSFNLRAPRALGIGSALVAALATLAVVLPAPAHASANGCVWSSLSNPRSCVEVVGAGEWVDFVRPGIDLLPRGSFHGIVHYWGPGFSHTTPVGTWWNQSWFHHQTYWMTGVNIRRNLPNGSKVCAQAIDARGTHPAACETIHA